MSTAYGKIVWWSILAVALATAFLRADTLTVATWNVQNYVPTNRMVEGTYRENYPKPETEKRALRAVIRALNADVIAIQEMGPRPYLEELRKDLAQEGCVYEHAELLESADPDRHVAVLSRRPFVGVTGHTDLNFKYFGEDESVKRGVLEIRLATDAGEVALWVVHLKSRYTDRKDDPESAIRRAAEAQVVRERVLKVFPEPEAARFLIVGDFNDHPVSKPLSLLTRRGKADIARVLPVFDSRGETWTHFYKKEDVYSRVDHILVSPGLMPFVKDGKGTIGDQPDVRQASDHRPVMVTLELKKKPE